MDLRYSAQKKIALPEFRPEYLRDWALAIPPAKLQGILEQLPPVKGGFRPGKDVPVRLQAYFGRMSRWSEEDWFLFGRLWILWTRAHPAIEEGLGVTTPDRLIETVQVMVDAPEARRQALVNLVLLSRGGQLTQEIIRIWDQTGPFPPDPEVHSIISSAQTATEAAVPGRIAVIEQRAGQLDNAFQALGADLKSVWVQIRSLQKTAGVVPVLDSAVKSTEEQVKHLSTRLLELEEGNGRASKGLDSLDNQIRKTRSEVTNLQLQLQALSAELVKCRDIQETFSLEQRELAESASTMNVELRQIRERVDNLSDIVASLGSQMKPIAEPPVSLTTGSHLTARKISADEPMELDSLESAVSHLARNLNLLGIMLPQAQALSLDIIAAITTGQLVTLTGSLAGIVAERCALSLASTDVKQVRIPVGLIDTQCLDTFLDLALTAADTNCSSTAVILDNANFSAFEVYAAGLRRFVAERVLGLTDSMLQLLLFICLTDGPATVQHGKGLLEVGPMFDTDALGWLDSPAKPPIPGCLCPDVWSSLTVDRRVDWEDAWVPDWFVRSAGPLWRRALSRAAMVRSALTHSSADPALELAPELAFGWILPMGLEISPEELNSVLQNASLDVRSTTLAMLYGVEVDSQ